MNQLHELAEQLGGMLRERGEMLAVAESCTGGWLGEVITAVPRASYWFDRGFITYSNAAKTEMLGVSKNILGEFGAVSEATVKAMAQGVLQHSQAQHTIAISGIAGPGNGSEHKPVGTVCIAWLSEALEPSTHTFLFKGDRQSIRHDAVHEALAGLIKRLS